MLHNNLGVVISLTSFENCKTVNLVATQKPKFIIAPGVWGTQHC